jgi:hypothetical protein
VSGAQVAAADLTFAGPNTDAMTNAIAAMVRINGRTL